MDQLIKSDIKDSKEADYKAIVKSQFLAQFNQAKEFKLPAGYIFPLGPPNLMQKRIAVNLKDSKYLLNYSEMGAGKTLSAILAGRHVDAKFVLILCPNQVISTWKKEIELSFSSNDILFKTFNPKFQNNSPYKYLILNYEMFQQHDSLFKLEAFVKSYNIDFLIIDEVHRCKQRDKNLISIRRKNIQALRSLLQQKNPNLYVLSMTGTPIINNLEELKSQIELTTGIEEKLEIKPSIQNIMRGHQRLCSSGVRYVPKLSRKLLVQQPKVDITDKIEDIKKAFSNQRTKILELEKILTKAKLPLIISNIPKGEKVIIYNHYINGEDYKIKDIIADELIKNGFKISFWDGEDIGGKNDFKDNDVDVLLVSSAVSTGVDGLQHLCNKLIVNILPWTNADYMQLVSRLYRQGQNKDVTVIIPISFIKIDDNEWSYDQYKWDLIQFKRTLADAVISGSLPEGEIISTDKALLYLKQWLKRVEDGNVNDFEKQMITPYLFEDEFSDEDQDDEDDEVKEYKPVLRDNLWHSIQQNWSISNSSTVFEKYSDNPQEWLDYHKVRNEFIKKWDSSPTKEVANWCLDTDEKYTIGDFGCGIGEIESIVGKKHNVYSFDFVAANDKVIACDMSDTPLGDKELDVAIFCLSLITLDCKNSLLEAHRVLKMNKFLHIIEPADKFTDIDLFIDSVESIGYTKWKVKTIGTEPEFTHLIFIKDREINKDVDINW